MSSPENSDVARAVGDVPRLQRREWLVERVGWLVMAAVVFAGLLGVWSHGVVSETETSSGTGRLSVQYERFVRNIGQTQLVVRVSPGGSEHGAIRLRVSQEYMASNEVQAVTPEPTATFAQGGEFVFEFPADEQAQLLMRLDLRPTGGMGSRGATVTTAGESVRIRQFVYP